MIAEFSESAELCIAIIVLIEAFCVFDQPWGFITDGFPPGAPKNFLSFLLKNTLNGLAVESLDLDAGGSGFDSDFPLFCGFN